MRHECYMYALVTATELCLDYSYRFWLDSQQSPQRKANIIVLPMGFARRRHDRRIVEPAVL